MNTNTERFNNIIKHVQNEVFILCETINDDVLELCPINTLSGGFDKRLVELVVKYNEIMNNNKFTKDDIFDEIYYCVNGIKSQSEIIGFIKGVCVALGYSDLYVSSYETSDCNNGIIRISSQV